MIKKLRRFAREIQAAPRLRVGVSRVATATQPYSECAKTAAHKDADYQAKPKLKIHQLFYLFRS